jgi:hypothetical protein
VDLLLFQFLVKEGFLEHTFYSFNDEIISDSFIDRKTSDFLGIRELVGRFNGFRKTRVSTGVELEKNPSFKRKEGP